MSERVQGEAELSCLMHVRWHEEGTHHSCFTPGPWDRHSSFRCAGTLPPHCRVGTGQAELTASPPALCSFPADCCHCQLLDNMNPFWVLQEQGSFAQIPTDGTSIHTRVQLEEGKLPSVSGDKPCQIRTCHSSWASRGIQQQAVGLVRATQDKIRPQQLHSIFSFLVCALSCNSMISIP